MRLFIILVAAVGGLIFSSCNDKKHQQHASQDNETPRPLQEDNKEYSLFSKRGPGDLVDELYRQLEKEDPALKQLSENIRELYEQKRDSSKAFLEFAGKNDSYYNAARQHNGMIGDSVLKSRIRLLVNNSIEQYESHSRQNNNLIKLFDSKTATLGDLQEALKIIRTLPVMEKYQQKNLPPVKPLENVIKEYDKTIRLADSLMGK